MIEPQKLSYNDFPVNTASAEGMKVIPGEVNKYNVRWFHDVPYSRRNGIELKLQILYPVPTEQIVHEGNVNMANRFPLIVYVPGSAWHRQVVLDSVINLIHYANEGYVVALVEYCGTDDGGIFPTHVYDVKNAIRFLKQNADTYFINPDKIILFGDSSGGHTALLAGITGNDALLEEGKKGDCSVCGIVDFYGPTDITTMKDDLSTTDHVSALTPEGYLIGQKNIVEYYEEAKKAAVIQYVPTDKKIPPLFMLHGNKDRLVPFSQSVSFYKQLKEKGQDAEFYCLDQADHGGRPFWTENVQKLVLAFIERCF